jgi:prolyl oligopeptidase
LLVKPIEDFPLYQPFVNFPSTFSEEAQNDLRQRGTSVLRNEVLPAFETFAKFYKEEYFPKAKPEIGATQRYEDGEKFYAFRIRRFTTTNLTAKEIHEIGLREVTRIKGRMAEIIKATNFAGEFDAFVEFLRTDPQFYYSKPGDLLTGYRDICKRMDAELPLLFGKLPRAPYGVREIPAHEAPRATTAYYNQPSADGSRPGWFFANTYDLKSRPKYEMEALTLHEAVPGHHLQIALQMELENVPKFRTVASYTAFVEGWGLYAESLGKEAGFYTDPYFEFGFLSYEMWRALRLVVDTGMHAFGWSRERAIEFMLANSALTRTNVENEVDRYIAWPGQALAYKIGQLKIRELRTEAETALGEAFDVRTFHDQVLSAGAVPLDILEARFDEWLSQLK